MGANSFPAWFFTFILLCLYVSAFLSSAQVTAGSQACIDGTYQHDGRTCCRCAAGMHVVKHCTANQQHGECKACDSDTYSSHPTGQTSCEPCTSCSQDNANLVEDEPCTAARDRKCRCKEDHYCPSGTDTCTICHQCEQCVPEGIKVPCTARNNSVCNVKTDGGYDAGTKAGIVVGVLLVLLVFGLIGFVIWKKKGDGRRRQPITEDVANGKAPDVEMQPIAVPVVDLQPHLHELAEVIGWKDMHYVAKKSNIPRAAIESCQLDNNKSQDQTYQLLEMWVEKQGRNASKELVKILHKGGKMAAKDRVMDILSRESPSV